ncbi:DUF6678 family protein [Gottfriedia sp. NPDC057991]|uniref:DUF6678 family protein n=1 Tax=Gottfriedia sp. NPDC057991 TaxID=3346298 RepID=UPI0036DBD7F4
MANNQYQQVMNDKKWEEIRLSMCDYPNNNQWRTKDIETRFISTWDGEWFYHFRIGGYKCIEWLEIKVETQEIRKGVLNILKNIHVSGDVFDNVIRVYGYV